MFADATEMDKKELRIVLLGKTGVGKSAVGNTILGETVFKTECSLTSGTHICQRAEKVINGRRIVVIDTPGVFDPDRSEKDLKQEIISSLVECAPGPHVFIVVLKVERHTKENQKALEQLLKYFSDSIYRHMIILFTHGDDLEGKKISDLINQYDEKQKSAKYSLKDVAEKCGNRVYVIDNRYWKRETKDIKDKMALTVADNTPWFNELSCEDENLEAETLSENEENQNNEYQLTQLMKSVRYILRNNNGHYSNETLEEIGEVINVEVDNIVQKLGDERENVDMVEIRSRARERVRTQLGRHLSGVAVGTLLGALLAVGVGLAAPVVLVAGCIRAGYKKITDQRSQARGPPAQAPTGTDVGAGAVAGAGVVAGAIAEAGALAAGAATGIGAAVGAGALLLYGAVKGGASGYKVAKRSDNPKEAADKASQTVIQKAEDVLKTCWNLGKTETGKEYEKLDNKQQ